MWKEVVTLFQEYMGTGLIIGWFLLSVVFLFVREKRRPVRIIFVYVPVILLLLFFNPLFARLVYGFVGEEIYYRILWLIPVTAVIAYAMIQLYGMVRGKIRIAFILLGCILVMISGSFIYRNRFFREAENLYHMPQAVVDICDAIQVEGREVMAVFPMELLQYVRQYSPVVCMPYGRELLVDRWGNNHELYDVMESAVIDASSLAELAREERCHYVILGENREMAGSLTDYDYELFGRMDGYVIYRNLTENVGLTAE